MLLSNCTTTTPETKSKTDSAVIRKPVVIDTSCNWVKPILISKADNVTDGTARQILAHNRAVEKNCPK